MPKEAIKYRRIFVVQPSHDLSALKKYSDNIVLITTGYERDEDLPRKISEMLADFNPAYDAIVPIGKLISTMLTGMAIQAKCYALNSQVDIGMYREKDYEFLAMGVFEHAT
jgi:hypothetical protein